ncbi:hypothetical protein HK097_005963 [Rhizophlyctis rosea]|uniref:TmcB/TmcC TPR repeats domain-containing protein n=1 Tax=Rhizophlyctis rosea TaxID=64517 RepID=A0AAD5X8V7_9FUNG|nr:hypothetical protein HK097_005963 [Rhizophlyctis rosea]
MVKDNEAPEAFGILCTIMEDLQFRGLSLYALKTLRFLTVLGGTVLFMPILEILFVAIDCRLDGTMYHYEGVKCFGGANALATVLAIIGLVFFLPYTVAMTSVYFDISPAMPSPTARSPLGRVDFWYTLIRIALVTAFTFSTSPILHLCFLIPCLVALCYFGYFYQQFYKQVYNEIRAAIWTSALFMAVVAAIAYGTKKGDKDVLFISVFAFGGVGLGVGVLIVKLYRRNVENHVYSGMQKKRLEQNNNNPLQNPFTKQKSGITGALERGDFNEDQAFTDINKIVRTHTVKKDIKVFRHPGEVEIACRFLFHNRDADALYLADQIFQEGFRQWPRDAMLNLVYANYIVTFLPGRDQDAGFHINRAKKLRPTFDAKFFIFMQDRTLEQLKRTRGLNSSTMNISSYVEFQTMQNGARANHLAALVELREFLTHVRSSSSGKDPTTYPIFLQRISEAEQRANAYYQKLVARWPKSKVLLRMYATFLLQVKNDTETATRLMAIADEIEDYETHQGTSFNMGGSRRSSIMPSYPQGYGMFQAGPPQAQTLKPGDDLARSKETGSVIQMTKIGIKPPIPGTPRKSSLRAPSINLPPPTQGRQVLGTGLYEEPEEGNEQNELLDPGYPIPLRRRSISLPGAAALDDGTPFIPVSLTKNDSPSMAIPSEDVVPRHPDFRLQSPPTRSMSFTRQESGSTDSSADGDLTKAEFGGSKDMNAGRMSGNGVAFRSQSSFRSDPTLGLGGMKNEFQDNYQRSESNPSTKSEERQQRQQVLFRSQMETRMKTPVRQFDIRQKFLLVLFIALMVAAVGLGVYQFKDAENTFNSFRTSTVISFNSAQIMATTRFLTLIAGLDSPSATDLSRFTSNIATLKQRLNIYNNSILPYLLDFHDDTAHLAEMEISHWPTPQPSLERWNAHYVGVGLFERGLQIAEQGMAYFKGNSDENNNLRFFFDNMLAIGDLYEEIAKAGESKWATYTLRNSYISWAFICAIVLLIVCWLFVMIRPMMKQTHEEQVRALKMFSLVPRKALLIILTRVEEQIETIADEMAAANGGEGTKGSARDLQIGGGHSRAKEVLTRRAHGKGANAHTKYFRKFLLGLILVGCGAIGILVPPLARTYEEIKLAGLLNYAGSRRYFAQAVQMMSIECLVQDRLAWRPKEAEMWYRDRLDTLVTVHTNVIQGIGIEPPAHIPQLYAFTSQYAPCNTACGNRTLGLDAQIDAFIDLAETYWSDLMTGRVVMTPGKIGWPTSDQMFVMMQNLATNLRTFDDIVEEVVIAGNQTAQDIMVVLFAITVVGTVVIYVAVLRVATRQRMTEMDSVVTLLFTLPESVVEDVPEIKRFIESGGMFTDGGGYKSRRKKH